MFNEPSGELSKAFAFMRDNYPGQLQAAIQGKLQGLGGSGKPGATRAAELYGKGGGDLDPAVLGVSQDELMGAATGSPGEPQLREMFGLGAVDNGPPQPPVGQQFNEGAERAITQLMRQHGISREQAMDLLTAGGMALDNRP